MLQRDFLMRMIERLAGAFARAIHAGDDIDPPEQLRLLESSVSEVFHTPSSLIHLIPERDLREHATHTRAHLGRVFCLLATLHPDPPKRRAHAARAFICLEDLLGQEAPTGPPFHESLHAAFRAAPPQDTTPWLALFDHARSRGDYAGAEDVLFDALDSGADLTTQGLSFYDDLLAMDDDAIALGGLTRDEAAESRAEIA